MNVSREQNTDSETQKIDLWLPQGTGWGEMD